VLFVLSLPKQADAGTVPSMTPIQSEDIEALVAAARTGDRDAYQQIVLAVHREVRVFIAVRTGSTELVEEVLQQTLVVAWQQLSRYEQRGTFQAWLKGIARNLLLKELAARRRTCAIEGAVLDGLVTEHDLVDLQGEVEEQGLIAQRLAGCLERLGMKARRLVTRRYIEGLSLEHLATEAGMSVNLVAVTLFRIRKTLRSCLESK
jgi:RNA polymerase sigma-70 factor, ECF subfamily